MRFALISVLALAGLILAGCAVQQGNNVPVPENQSQENGMNSKAIVSQDVNYYEDTTGYFVRPMIEGNYPGVILIHEWWGLNDNIRNSADELASEGYQVLAVDLYNGVVATTREEALAQVTSLNQADAIANLRAAKDYLESNGAARIGSLGWCFGGGQSLRLSLSGEELDATVIYYGNLVTDEENLTAIEWPVLGIFGSEDSSIPVSRVTEFESSLDNLGIQNEIYVYEGVGHAFANPSGDNFAPEQTRDAWMKTLAFLEENLKGGR